MPMNKENLYKDVETVFNNVIHSLADVNDKQLNDVPFVNGWTIGQVAEHIIICSKGIPDNKVTDANRPIDAKAGALRDLFLNMEQKSTADPRVTPSAPPHNKKELTAALEYNKEMLLKIIIERNLSELCVDAEFPYMGYFTRCEWLYFIYVHTQRHLNQINSIRQILSGHS